MPPCFHIHRYHLCFNVIWTRIQIKNHHAPVSCDSLWISSTNMNLIVVVPGCYALTLKFYVKCDTSAVDFRFLLQNDTLLAQTKYRSNLSFMCCIQQTTSRHFKTVAFLYILMRYLFTCMKFGEVWLLWKNYQMHNIKSGPAVFTLITLGCARI